ncbi:MAG: succinate dehydrogenase [Deltaproteobacteria bacterium]|nr:succinate dehydrogenase [Deltaproteobacteria bacterium]
MSETTPGSSVSRPFLETRREDNWWVGPMATAMGLLAFTVYTTWAALQGEHYSWGPYLSPFYSPLIKPEGWPLSPAILILWAPGGFRLTCYYYRKSYYRAFMAMPPACAVAAAPHKYRGERALFIFQNLHRFFFYLAMLFVVILTYDAIIAFNFDGSFGIGVGSIVLTLNAVFIAAFTFGCNSFRHLVGGNVDCYSCASMGKQRHLLWRVVTFFNKKHMEWAWISLFWVGFSDAYVRLVSMGIITDMRIL